MIVTAMFGGGLVAWSLSYIVLALATIGFAVFVAWHDGYATLARVPLAGRIALIGIAILPLLQLAPLPSAAWRMLPGQELRLDVLTLAGMADRWQPLTLEPASTAPIAILAIGFAAFVILLLRLPNADYRRLLFVAFALVLLSIAIGGLQVVSDGQFPQLQASNMGATMLGFYANKNHMALVIACSILLFGFAMGRDAAALNKSRLLVAGYIAFALVCILTTNSRAGLGLGFLASAIVVADLARGVSLRYRLVALVAVGALALAVMSSSAFEMVSGRVDDVSGDLRWRIASWSWPLAERYWALGIGFGSFKTVFGAHEQLAWVKPTYVNAAHDDYLQLLIEGGVPGCALLVALVLSFVGSAKAFRALPQGMRRDEIILGAGLLALFAIHSAVDYPLRRPAAWIFFAIGLSAIYRRGSADDMAFETSRADPKRLDG